MPVKPEPMTTDEARILAMYLTVVICSLGFFLVFIVLMCDAPLAYWIVPIAFLVWSTCYPIFYKKTNGFTQGFNPWTPARMLFDVLSSHVLLRLYVVLMAIGTPLYTHYCGRRNEICLGARVIGVCQIPHLETACHVAGLVIVFCHLAKRGWTENHPVMKDKFKEVCERLVSARKRVDTWIKQLREMYKLAYAMLHNRRAGTTPSTQVAIFVDFTGANIDAGEHDNGGIPLHGKQFNTPNRYSDTIEQILSHFDEETRCCHTRLYGFGEKDGEGKVVMLCHMRDTAALQGAYDRGMTDAGLNSIGHWLQVYERFTAMHVRGIGPFGKGTVALDCVEDKLENSLSSAYKKRVVFILTVAEGACFQNMWTKSHGSDYLYLIKVGSRTRECMTVVSSPFCARRSALTVIDPYRRNKLVCGTGHSQEYVNRKLAKGLAADLKSQ